MSKKKRIVEGIKSLVILALTCSAIMLIIRGQLFGEWDDLLGHTRPDENNIAAATSQAQAALPLRMAVINEMGCFGIQYSSADLKALFNRMAPLLSEALGSASVPVPVSKEVWEWSLQAAPSIYFDYQGNIPMRVLSGWLSGQENANLTINARHLTLAVDGDSVQLYFLDEDNNQYWSCSSDLVSTNRLQTAVADIVSNNTIFAFQSDAFSELAPYTMILEKTPRPVVYTAANPLYTDKEERLKVLLESLSFPQGITSFYDTPEGLRARSGNDTLTISDNGLVTYHTTDAGQRYPISYSGGNGTLYAAVESARQLVQKVLGQWYKESRLYLSKVESLAEESWRIEFGYVLDDTPVVVGQRGYAASVVVRQNHIVEYEMQLRSYMAINRLTELLPEKQAMGILVYLGQSGGQLQLCYQDNASEQIQAGWVVW